MQALVLAGIEPFPALNFIGHHHLHFRARSPEFALGKQLPDLLRHVHVHLPKRFVPNINSDLVDGIRVHQQADKLFHQSEFFERANRKAVQLMLELDLQVLPKYWFYRHVMVELILDRSLMVNFPNLVSDFYAQLEEASMPALKATFQANNMAGFDDFTVWFKRFRESQYLFHYQNTESIVYALERIGQRVKLKVFETKVHDRMLATVESFGLFPEDELAQLFTSLEEAIPS